MRANHMPMDPLGYSVSIDIERRKSWSVPEASLSVEQVGGIEAKEELDRAINIDAFGRLAAI